MKGLRTSGRAAEKNTVLKVRRWVPGPEQQNCGEDTASVWVFILSYNMKGVIRSLGCPAALKCFFMDLSIIRAQMPRITSFFAVTFHPLAVRTILIKPQHPRR